MYIQPHSYDTFMPSPSPLRHFEEVQTSIGATHIRTKKHRLAQVKDEDNVDMLSWMRCRFKKSVSTPGGA